MRNDIIIISCLIFLFAHLLFGSENKNVKISFTYSIKITGSVKNFKLKLNKPLVIPHRQKIIKEYFSIKSDKSYKSNNDLEYLEFFIKTPANKEFINIKYDLEISQFDLRRARLLKDGSKLLQIDSLLKPERYFEVDNLSLINEVRNIKANSRINLVEKLYYLTMKKISYKLTKENKGALKGLLSGIGDCSEYSDLLVTFCRIKKIPARVCTGYISSSVDNPAHSWVEIYFIDIGWVPFDPTFDDNNGSSKFSSFSHLLNTYIYVSNIRNDKKLENGVFTWQWEGSGKVNVLQKVVIDSPSDKKDIPFPFKQNKKLVKLNLKNLKYAKIYFKQGQYYYNIKKFQKAYIYFDKVVYLIPHSKIGKKAKIIIKSLKSKIDISSLILVN